MGQQTHHPSHHLLLQSMSSAKETNAAIPKAVKYGSSQKLGPLSAPLTPCFHSATWEFWTESQQDHLGFVIAFLGKTSASQKCSSAGCLIPGCMTYGSTKWQGWLLGEKEGLEHIKFASVFYPFFSWFCVPLHASL